MNLSLLDVIYGVVFAYGFSIFDQIHSTDSYIRFFFAYAVLIIDWIYFHYSTDKETNKVSFICDIVILFSFSRILFNSAHSINNYFLWLAVIYIVYAIWDFINKKILINYNWIETFVVDLTAGLIFLVISILISSGIIRSILFADFAAIFIFLIVIWFWFRNGEATDS